TGVQTCALPIFLLGQPSLEGDQPADGLVLALGNGDRRIHGITVGWSDREKLPDARMPGAAESRPRTGSRGRPRQETTAHNRASANRRNRPGQHLRPGQPTNAARFPDFPVWKNFTPPAYPIP